MRLPALCATMAIACARPVALPTLPVPPAQDRPFARPALSDAKLASAAELMFAAGLADPRDCDYREITVLAGHPIVPAAPVKTHGWVLPGQAYAIGLNGLLYPTLGIGARADFTADARAAIAADPTRRAARGETFTRFTASSEGLALSYTDLSSLWIPFLLRLGHDALAVEAWATIRQTLPAHTNENDDYLADPFVLFARDLAWAFSQRALQAHVRADDRLTFATADRFASVLAALRSGARERGLCDPLLQLTYPQLPALVADARRRLTTRRRVAADRGSIAALIDQLDQVAGLQADLRDHPIVAALIARGREAVGPLLDTMEKDPRLTRLPRAQATGTLFSVADAAEAALEAIFGTREFLAPEGASQAERARAIRAYVRTFAGVPAAERWVRVLAQDDAGFEAWLDAARHIAGLAAAPAGSTALVARRVDALASAAERSEAQHSALHQACELAMLLAVWDRAAALPVLAAQVERARKSLSRWRSGEESSYDLPRDIARMTRLRAEGGDAAALADYARWLATTTPESLGLDLEHVLAPVWDHPTDPAMNAAVAAAFAARPIPPRLLGTRLVEVPAFRRRLLLDLGDATAIGTIEIGDDEMLHLQVGFDSRWVLQQGAAALPVPRRPLPRRELVAFWLSQSPGFPGFRFSGSPEEREAAIRAIASVLARRGEE